VIINKLNHFSHNVSSSRLAILFSGGIDSMILAALADKHVPQDQTIDLLNVAFGTNFDVPDRKTGISGLTELRS
jgi:asparagine synthetase B (glutamine-hydrolysing)